MEMEMKMEMDAEAETEMEVEGGGDGDDGAMGMMGGIGVEFRQALSLFLSSHLSEFEGKRRVPVHRAVKLAPV